MSNPDRFKALEIASINHALSKFKHKAVDIPAWIAEQRQKHQGNPYSTQFLDAYEARHAKEIDIAQQATAGLKALLASRHGEPSASTSAAPGLSDNPEPQLPFRQLFLKEYNPIPKSVRTTRPTTPEGWELEERAKMEDPLGPQKVAQQFLEHILGKEGIKKALDGDPGLKAQLDLLRGGMPKSSEGRTENLAQYRAPDIPSSARYSPERRRLAANAEKAKAAEEKAEKAQAKRERDERKWAEMQQGLREEEAREQEDG